MTRTGSRLGRLLHYLLTALLVLVGIAMLAALVGLAIAAFAPGLWPAGATIRAAGNPAVALSAPGDRVLACAFLIVGTAMVAAVLVPLIGLMRSAAAGMPFVAENVARLRAIAWVFVAFALARIVVPLVAGRGCRRCSGWRDRRSICRRC